MIEERLRFAIANTRLIAITYHGRSRTGEPHDYGLRNGTLKLLFFQLREAGRSRRGDAKGWRLLEVSTIAACDVLDDVFRGSRGQSHRQHLDWDELFARVG